MLRAHHEVLFNFKNVVDDLFIGYMKKKKIVDQNGW